MSAAGPKTVLYVEDNLVNVFLVEAIFESRPWVRLLTAITGRAGLDLAKGDRPDLILLDLNLPDMTGEDYLRELRSVEAGSDIPVVIVSGDAMSEQRTHFHGLGVADYITKPFDVNSFKAIVDRYLGQSDMTSP